MATVSERNAIPSEILDDLSSRFIVNIPEEERREPIRLCFQVELAYWFYLDFFCVEDPNLKACGMKEFTAQIFQHIPFLSPLLKNLDQIIEDWRSYKSSVPTYGAIVLNEELTKVLLVQSYFSKSSWGFPKGKVNELETPYNCAVREVFEETGLDISKMIDENDFIEAIVNDQTIRLYIVSGVNENVKFQPKTRNEIRSVEWFYISDLPTNKKDMTSKVKIGFGPNSFFMVLPFMKRVRNWIQEKKQKTNKYSNGQRHRNKSTGETPTNTSPVQPVPGVSKNKGQAQACQALQNELPQYSNVKNPNSVLLKNARNVEHSLRANCQQQSLNENEAQRDLNSRRVEHEVSAENFPSGNNHGARLLTVQEDLLIVPNWLNFKLDRHSILKCFDD